MNSVSFMPRMQSEATGFELVDELCWRGWAGIVADVWHVECNPGAHGSYISPDPRLFVVLDLTPGGTLELEDGGCGEVACHSAPLSMSYIPGGVRVKSTTRGIRRLRHLDLHLPEAALTRRFGRLLKPDRMRRTRLQFTDRRVAALASLIAEECANSEPRNDSYGEGLLVSLLCALFDLRRGEPRSRPSLSRRQLSQSMDYIDAHCFETIRLHDLASLLGLSETYFSHAFKASTGVPPLRWQMEARIGKVKELLGDQTVSLTEVAAMAGFSDQAHLTRAFKKLVGQTPSEWRRNSPEAA